VPWCVVVFDEEIFPFKDLHPNAGARLHSEILLLPSSLRNDPGDGHLDDHLTNVPIYLPLILDNRDIMPVASDDIMQQSGDFSGAGISEDLSMSAPSNPSVQPVPDMYTSSVSPVHDSAGGDSRSANRVPSSTVRWRWVTAYSARIGCGYSPCYLYSDAK